MHVMDLYYEWKGLILHLAYRQGYFTDFAGRGGGVRIWNFQGVLGKWKVEFLQGLIKNNWEFPRVIKNISCVEFPKFLVLGLNTILLSSPRWSFVLSEISRGKVRKLKFSGFFSKKVFSQHLSVFSGIALILKI